MMMNKTGIEYLDFTWNPIAMRCTPVGPGCANCWHLAMADRMAGNSAFPEDVRAAYAGSGPPVLIEKRLDEPLKRKKPAMIGVQFMGDLFYENVPTLTHRRVFQMMLQCPQHTFLVLTKRPVRMRDAIEFWFWSEANETRLGGQPPKNLWLGVSVENQKTADERIPLLLETPAAKRIVSYEPALGPVDVAEWLQPKYTELFREAEWEPIAKDDPRYNELDWVICGGESGPGARPMHPQWARDVRDQCQEAGVPYFFKGWGAWAPTSSQEVLLTSTPCQDLDGTLMSRVGKREAGRLLDGRIWDEMPEVTHD